MLKYYQNADICFKMAFVTIHGVVLDKDTCASEVNILSN